MASYRSPFPLTSGLRPDDDVPGEKVSVIVPFYNEEECVAFVLKEVTECQPDAEIIAVDDGSTDRTWEIIADCPGVTGIRLTENRGQSAAIYSGLRSASGDICVLMDGDGQNDPADIEKLVGAVKGPDCDIACGRRANRKDTWSKRTASRIANGIRRAFIHDGISDTGCSLKAFPKDCVDLLLPFNGLHRFLPALFTRAGLQLSEIEVSHRPRKAGKSKYSNWERALRGIYDLIGVCWLLRRRVHYPALESSSRRP